MKGRDKRLMMYLPTVDGQPARFCSGYQLCIGGGRRFYVEPVPSLREVRKQIRSTIYNRLAHGLEVNPERYGYVRVKVAR